MKPLKLGKISYLNVLPLYYPLESQIIPNSFKIIEGIPADLNIMMQREELDISGTSSIEYARNWRKYLLVPDISIGSNGPVKSVLFLSQVPFKKMHDKRVVVSSHTHTSAALLSLLFKKEGIEPRIETGSISSVLKGNNIPHGVLAIGDEALMLRKNSPFKYIMDLGEEWRKWTGLPFIFGVWVVNRKRAMENPHEMEKGCCLLLKAKKWGISHLPFFAKRAEFDFVLGYEEILEYFKGLVYNLGKEELKGLITFYKLLYEHSFIEEPPTIDLFKI